MKHLTPKTQGGVRLVVADPHPLLLAGIKSALAEAGGVEVVGEAGSASEVLELVSLTKPDVVLLDLGLGALDDYWCLRRLRADSPGTKVVVLSSNSQAELRRAFSEGASAFILTTIDPADLPDAIGRAATATVLAPFGSRLASSAAIRQAGLTEREIEVLRALSDGLSNREIALVLTITEQTVKFHLSNVYRKLGVRGRSGAVRWTFERGARSVRLGGEAPGPKEGPDLHVARRPEEDPDPGVRSLSAGTS